MNKNTSAASPFLIFRIETTYNVQLPISLMVTDHSIKDTHSGCRIATLREAFRNTPKWLGFNIELKYPTEAQIAAMPFRFYSRNYFADSILKAGFSCTRNRTKPSWLIHLLLSGIGPPKDISNDSLTILYRMCMIMLLLSCHALHYSLLVYIP